MKRLLVTALTVLGLTFVASADVDNGTFDAGLSGWTWSGGATIRNAGEFGWPASPSGGQFSGVILSWGGDWAAPVGSMSQSLSGITGAMTLSGEIYAMAHSGDAWRDTRVDVLWNGSVVASLQQSADPVKWPGDFPWVSFSVPVLATGNDLLAVNYTAHFAEWTWVGADNLHVAPVPEPTGLALLFLGVPMLAFGLRRKNG